MNLRLGRLLMREQPASVWCLDAIEIEGDCLVLDGWALAPTGARPALTVNGLKLSSRFGGPRPDLQKVMAFDPRAPAAAFHVEHPGIAGTLARSDSLEIQFCDEATLRPFNPSHAFYWPLHPPDHPFPEAARRKRVHGDMNADGFVISGYSTFRKLSRALANLDRGWESFSSILDWGCGCGRVLRYLSPGGLGRLVGADVDADNIEWCKGSFPGAEFHAVPLAPPTLLQAGRFDLVVGISVFTHLREKPQLAWLEELSRITRRGALLLVTIHGPAAGARANISEEQYREWMDQGFVATGLNVDLVGAISDDTYYVNSLHTHEYVRRVWGRFFDIIRIYDSSVANHQDLVAMRKR